VQEDGKGRRKKNFEGKCWEANPAEEDGISNRLLSSTFILPLT
jgi:hypothetical protein